jgi:hypothetical protein
MLLSALISSHSELLFIFIAQSSDREEAKEE